MPRYVIDPSDLKFVLMAMEERCAAEAKNYNACVQGAAIVLEEIEGIVTPHKPAGRIVSMNGKRKKRKY